MKGTLTAFCIGVAAGAFGVIYAAKAKLWLAEQWAKVWPKVKGWFEF